MACYGAAITDIKYRRIFDKRGEIYFAVKYIPVTFVNDQYFPQEEKQIPISVVITDMEFNQKMFIKKFLNHFIIKFKEENSDDIIIFGELDNKRTILYTGIYTKLGVIKYVYEQIYRYEVNLVHIGKTRREQMLASRSRSHIQN